MRKQALRLGLVLWVAGMAGAAALTHALLPALRATSPLPAAAVAGAALLQSAVLLAAAVWVGVVLGARLGLRAPFIEAVLEGKDAGPVWRAQLGPAVAVGGGSALFIVLTQCAAPVPLLQGDSGARLPLVARMLYGGLTEEILLRWGLMVLLAWAAWRVLQSGRGSPAGIGFVLAAIVSAVIFGLGHVPAAAGLGVDITVPVVLYITAANFVPGLLFGLLFWRRGLEAACIAHMLAHVGMELGAVLGAGRLFCAERLAG